MTATRTCGRPGRRFGAGGAQHPLPDLLDQAGFLGDRHEIGRRDHAAHRMPPAQQRLAAGDLVAAQIDLRLIVQLERALRQRRAQIRLQLAAMIGLLLHRRVEEAIGSAAGRLRGIHREIGVLQQIEQIGAVARGDRDADAGVAGKLMAMAVERRPQRLIDPRDQRVDILGALDAVLQDGEFIAAEAGDEILRPDRLAQPLRDALEELVADQMSQRIVDALELVDVDIEDRELGVSRFPGAILPHGAGTASGSADWSARRNGRDARSWPGRAALR